ncbi:hypothetical protein BU16DRAFT_566114 [Lophium mytilinum]|uniref:F-box domain-containing protein n=1 Tax=Lophium mytilinum TaxID=390894 RepID=A0A6A6QFL9_9PEZI|nr:hypothetical protein BU16DRAFT_566114 [Lophium mytilinum]
MPSQTKRKRDRKIGMARAAKARKAKRANKARKAAAAERLRTRNPTESFTKFLELPGELRNAVYELVLEPNATFTPATAHELVNSKQPERFALLAVNRQIHDETAAMLARRATCRLPVCVERDDVARPNRGQLAMTKEAIENFRKIEISVLCPESIFSWMDSITPVEETLGSIVAVSTTTYNALEREVTLDFCTWHWYKLEYMFGRGGFVRVNWKAVAGWKRCFQLMMETNTTIRWILKVPAPGIVPSSLVRWIKEGCEKDGFGYVVAPYACVI